MVKYLYSVGDSFSYGEGLLDSCRHLPRLSPWQKYDLSSAGLTNLYYYNREEYDQLVIIKNSYTIGGYLGKLLGAEFFNYAQPGAAIDSIMFQLHLVLEDIRIKNYSLDECFILVGLTTPFRKMHLGNLLKSDGRHHTPEELATCLTGSIYLSNPKFSAHTSTNLCIEWVKELTNSQFKIEFCFTVSGMANMLLLKKIPFMLLNIWSDSFMDTSEGVTNNMCKTIMGVNSVHDNLFPEYPASLKTSVTKEIYKENLNLVGHPNTKLNELWADLILPRVITYSTKI